MRSSDRRGMVLVACLLILALLSLLGAGSLFTATLDAKLTGNQAVNREAFYAAEAALEVGVGKIMTEFRDNLRPLAPGTYADWTEPSTALGDPYSNPFNTYTTSFRIRNALDPSAPALEPRPLDYQTVQNGQPILHLAYRYSIEATAEGTNGAGSMSETVHVLETPLVQYYVFYNDHLSVHPGPAMTSWGRIHTNENLYFAPETSFTFRDYDDATPGQAAPNLLTVRGQIRYGEYLPQNGGVSSRATGPIQVRLDGAYVAIDKHITDANQGAEEARFKDAGDTYHVRVGVDRLRTPDQGTLVRGGFYELEADSPRGDKVDAFRIITDAAGLHVYFARGGGARIDVTNWVRNYQVNAAGQAVNFATWPLDARTMANGAVAVNVGQLVPGSIVYSPEGLVSTNEDLGGALTANAARGAPATAGSAGANARYPCVLERQDGREAREVDFTVVDLQRLELWYRDYLDWTDGAWDNRPVPRQLLVYVSRTLAGGAPATGSGVGALQAVKLIGSRAGRSRDVADRQSGNTLLTRTTVATDNPLYLEGDFNAPGAASAPSVNTPGGFGCALLSDAITLLSNSWGATHWGQTGGAAGPLVASETTFNAALFTGRYNFHAGGAAGEEAGIHNLTRFLENWNGSNCNFTGCLINLWFSTKATAPHSSGGYYSPPLRRFGWDVAFAARSYWPPYVPSIYTVERIAWQSR